MIGNFFIKFICYNFKINNIYNYYFRINRGYDIITKENINKDE